MIVLDASALVDVLIDQGTAPWVLAQLAGEAVSAPAHQPAEVLSAIGRLRRSGTLTADAAAAALDEAASLGTDLLLPTPAHLREAHALDGRLRVLDALYVVLARDLDAALVTTDRRLAAASPPCEVRVPPR